MSRARMKGGTQESDIMPIIEEDGQPRGDLLSQEGHYSQNAPAMTSFLDPKNGKEQVA